MPIYEYQCSACGHKTDILQKFSDPPETHCPNCNQDALHKNITAPSFHLAGSGWYATDYKDKPAAAKADAETAPTEQKTDKETSAASAAPPKETPTKSADTATSSKKSSDSSES